MIMLPFTPYQPCQSVPERKDFKWGLKNKRTTLSIETQLNETDNSILIKIQTLDILFSSFPTPVNPLTIVLFKWRLSMSLNWQCYVIVKYNKQLMTIIHCIELNWVSSQETCRKLVRLMPIGSLKYWQVWTISRNSLTIWKYAKL